MKYFIIAGEASGDLHASHLMQALRRHDPAAEFTFLGGDLMSAVGGVRLMHYQDTAYMGFIPVLLHLPAILRNLHRCKRNIALTRPDAVILVDYPGFNLKIARFVKQHAIAPVYYYISPKIWAWKEHRIRHIRSYVDEMFSILPFEVPFYQDKHHYPIHYVGNPTAEEVNQYKARHTEDFHTFVRDTSLPTDRPIIALLAGSRRQEIRDNLTRMYAAAHPLTERGYQIVISCAPGIPEAYYHSLIDLRHAPHTTLFRKPSYRLLNHATAALVTSGTATLETALFRVPQVVCYHTTFGRLVSWLRRMFLKVPYISLVNLIAGREVVPELVAHTMTVENLRLHLDHIISSPPHRASMLSGYEEVAQKLGTKQSSEETATIITRLLGERAK